MQILGRTQMINTESTLEAVKVIMKLGFDGPEIDLCDKRFVPRADFLSPGFAEQMRNYLRDSRITAYSVGAHFDYVNSEDGFRTVSRAVDIASEMGADVLIVNGALHNREEAWAPQWARQIEALGKLCIRAERCGISLAVEYEPGFILDSTEKLLRAMKEIDSKSFMVNADIGHFFLQEKEPISCLRKLKDKIIHAHLEDMNRGIHDHRIPGEGDMDLPDYAEVFHEMGFSGLASLDLYGYDYEQVSPFCIWKLREIFG